MKLEGLKVIDLSLFLPGPYLTLMLADHGAEVIKVEPPGEGDPTRHLGPRDGGETVYFRNLNRGKKSVVVDLKNPHDREALLKLCDTADVFVESFRPGVVDRLSVGYEQVRARNPRIVHSSISAFGQQGPRHERSTGGSAFYRLYETADGRYLALGGQEMKFVRNLLGALGRPELASLCEKPGPHQQPVMHFLEGVFRAKSLAENLEFLSKLDVCYAPVHTLPEALDAAADKLLRDEQGRRHLAPPIRFRHEPARPTLREPQLGEHDTLKKRGP